MEPACKVKTEYEGEDEESERLIVARRPGKAGRSEGAAAK